MRRRSLVRRLAPALLPALLVGLVGPVPPRPAVAAPAREGPGPESQGPESQGPESQGPESAAQAQPAQESAAPQPPGPLSLLSQGAWAPPTGAVPLRLGIRPPFDGLSLHVAVHEAAVSRSALAAAAGGRPGNRVGSLDAEVAALLPTAEGTVDVVLAVQGAEPDPARPVPGRTGVYPVVVELRRPGARRPVDRLQTYVVVIAPGAVPLSVAWVWTLDATPAHRPGGGVRPHALEAFAPGGRLRRMVDGLEQGNDVPLTLAMSPETIEAWAEAAGSPEGDPAREGLERLRAQVSSPIRQVLAQTYVPLDEPALNQAGLLDEMLRARERGLRVLSATLGGAPDPGALMAGALDADGLALLQRHGVSRLVLDPASLAPSPERLTPARPFHLGPPGGPVAVLADPAAAQLLDGDGQPTLLATRFLAELTLVALEAPADARGLVVVSPPTWSPTPELLEQTFAALTTNPVLRPATVDGLIAAVAPRTTPRRLAEERRGAARRLPADAADLRSARRRLSAFAAVVGGDSPEWGQTERNLFLACSSQLGPAARREAERFLDGARGVMQRVIGRILAPDGQTITLTSRRAGVPILIRKETALPLRVRLRLDSDKLAFPGGNERLVELNRPSSTEHFVVEARTSGAFPLRITLTSPDGSLPLSETRLTIRSTASTGVGVLLTGAAGSFLLFWWGRELRRRRRARTRPAAPPEPLSHFPR